MSRTDEQQAGAIAWHDLTVERADEVRDFYQRVAGWEAREVDMGGYSDYAMFAPATGATAALAAVHRGGGCGGQRGGVCRARRRRGGWAASSG